MLALLMGGGVRVDDDEGSFGGVVADLAACFEQGEVESCEGAGVAGSPGDGLGLFEGSAGGDVAAGGEMALAEIPEAVEVRRGLVGCAHGHDGGGELK